MQVVSSRDIEARRAPEQYFTGTVWMDAMLDAPSPNGAKSFRVSFEPGARTHWHAHPEGQILYVVTGRGLIQKSGDWAREILAGDSVHIAPDEKHWHGAAPDSLMVHVAINPTYNTEGATEWMEEVTDKEYAEAPR
jgi:quercetin dioxygenase-like cupin family protein